MKENWVTGRAMDIPLSEYLSAPAAALYVERMRNRLPARSDANIDSYRLSMDERFFAPRLAAAKELWPVNIESAVIGGIRVDIVDPRAGVSTLNRDRLLLNFHGGGFCVGEGMGGLVESIPIATTLGIRVISVHYRQGPEHVFPAASEDVAAVYSELLTQFDARKIGMYGCSDGGLLAAMSVSWLLKANRPLPGAIALISSPAGPVTGGDSRYTSAFLDPAAGDPPPTPSLISPPYPREYLRNVDCHSALISPMDDRETLSRFPPTLLLAGTRATECSAVIQTYRMLTRAGAHAQLELWDGLWHGFVYDVGLPEAQEAFEVIGKFFNSYLRE
jgi:monoterpene epsilon-lactone hydrolase